MLAGHLDAPETQELEPGTSYLVAAPGPGRVPGRARAERDAAVHADAGATRVAVPTTIHCDHLIQARVEGVADLRESLAESGEVYAFLRSAAAKYGCGLLGARAPGSSTRWCSRTTRSRASSSSAPTRTRPTPAGLGACAVGVGGADAVEVIAGLPWEVLYPRHIAVYLTGELRGWTAPKDVVL